MNEKRSDMRIVRYHSLMWALLVETGYITKYVEDGLAVMLYHPKR